MMPEAGAPAWPEIRPMRREDLDELMEIERESFPVPWPPESFLEDLAREWARIEVLRAAPGEPIAAFVNYWLVRDEIHVLIVATRIAARRRGHGARLVEHRVEVARRERCRYLT